MSYPVPMFVPPYGAFVLPDPPVIPKLYWGALTQEERIRKLCHELHKICEYANTLGIAINLDHRIIAELEAEFEKFKESGFDDYYREQIEQWISDHLVEVMQALLNQGIFFGLTEDGYFCANVLMQLTIYFDTIMDYSSDDYGKLTLTY